MAPKQGDDFDKKFLLAIIQNAGVKTPTKEYENIAKDLGIEMTPDALRMKFAALKKKYGSGAEAADNTPVKKAAPAKKKRKAKGEEETPSKKVKTETTEGAEGEEDGDLV